MNANRSSASRKQFFRFGFREMLMLVAAIGAILAIIVYHNRESREARINRRFFKAAAHGDMQGVSEAIAAGAAINSFDASGQTALDYAVSNASLPLVDLLLEAGARPYHGNPLDKAVRTENPVFVKRLIEAGAPITGQTFKECINCGHVEIMELLLTTALAHPTPPSSPPAIVGPRLPSFDLEIVEVIQSNHPEDIKRRMIQMFLDHGADFGDLVERAVFGSDAKLLSALAQYGVPRTAREAVLLNRLEDLKRFISEDPSIVRDRVGYRRESLLGIAARHGFKEVAFYLLEAGAEINDVDDGGQTALHQAARGGDTEFVAALIEAGADVHRADNSGFTPLHIAAATSSDIVARLIKAGADVNARSINEKITPLHQAVAFGNSQIVRLLLEAGADPTVDAGSNSTPVAARFGTPLKLAKSNGNQEIVKLLEQHLDAKTQNSPSPITP